MDALSGRQAPATQQDLSAQTGSYTLHSIISRVPLSADGQDTDIRITCVEFWGETQLRTFLSLSWQR